MWIYRDNDLLFKYIVTTRPWPAGQIVGVAVTLRGARDARAAWAAWAA